MIEVTVEQAKIRLDELIAKAIRGEDVFITQGDQRVVQIVPVVQKERRPEFGTAKGLIKIADAFDEPLEEFKEYME